MPSTTKEDRKPAKLSSSKKQHSVDQKLRETSIKNGAHSKSETPSPRRARRKSDDASSTGTPKKRELKKQVSVDTRSKAGSTGKLNGDKKESVKSPKTVNRHASQSPTKNTNQAQAQGKPPLQRSLDTATKPTKQATLKKSPSQKSRTNRQSRTDDEKDDSDNGSYHDSEDNVTTVVSRMNRHQSRKNHISDEEEEQEQET